MKILRLVQPRPDTLRFAQVRFAARLLAARLALPVLVAAAPLPRILQWIDAPIRRSLSRRPQEMTSVASWLERWLARSRLVPNTCLYRSLARYSALRDAGIPVRFVMGVRRENGGMIGHAWLEWRGSPLGEIVDPRFVVTFLHPGRCARARAVPMFTEGAT